VTDIPSGDGVIALLEELVAWARFSNRASLLETWDTVLADDRHVVAYELSDGTRTQKEVGDAAELSQPTVSILWTKWRKLGIVRVRGNRVEHIARPTDMGYERAAKLMAGSKAKAKAPTVSESNPESSVRG
jgi:hypothetical protein